MNKANERIRIALKQSGVFQWQLAKRLSISEYTLVRMLRTELPKSKQDELLNIIKEMEVNEK